MKDPYEILGVSKNASKEEIDTAYKNLAAKYSQENYIMGPLKQQADDKMKEINQAYDQIVLKEAYENIIDSTPAAPKEGVKPDGSSIIFSSIRELINKKEFDNARELLNGVELPLRNAEWSFLFGTVLNETGFNTDAYIYFEKAYNIEPSNPEYSAAYNNMQRKRDGSVNSSPYPDINVTQRVIGCSPCDLCCGLVALDCCCSSVGGNCIGC